MKISTLTLIGLGEAGTILGQELAARGIQVCCYTGCWMTPLLVLPRDSMAAAVAVLM
ncbi:hypothetical protein [Pokkaliibacter plantistimulans]|uniref:hypothetical protein n=1 Tax=Pokkaliibacter plantistimulans TaxID=1635171 RepID=UPI0014036CFA|nr:hypothetical protein [Pokkaliibacter plantistimulans]